MSFGIGRGVAEAQNLKKKKKKIALSLELRLRNDIFDRSRLCRAPNSEKVKMALHVSLQLSGILR